MPPSEVTVSAMTSAPCAWAIAAIASALLPTPVEVSAWTNETILTSGFSASASSTLSREMGVPQSSSTTTGTPPVRSTFSSCRPPKAPLRHTSTLSPGSTRLTKQVSMPTEPGPDTGKVDPVLGLERVAQELLELVHHAHELGVEVADGRPRHGVEHALVARPTGRGP